MAGRGGRGALALSVRRLACRALRSLARAIGRRSYGFLQAGEAVNELVNVEQDKGAARGTACGNDEPQLAAIGEEELVYYS